MASSRSYSASFTELVSTVTSATFASSRAAPLANCPIPPPLSGNSSAETRLIRIAALPPAPERPAHRREPPLSPAKRGQELPAPRGQHPVQLGLLTIDQVAGVLQLPAKVLERGRLPRLARRLSGGPAREHHVPGVGEQRGRREVALLYDLAVPVGGARRVDHHQPEPAPELVGDSRLAEQLPGQPIEVHARHLRPGREANRVEAVAHPLVGGVVNDDHRVPDGGRIEEVLDVLPDAGGRMVAVNHCEVDVAALGGKALE